MIKKGETKFQYELFIIVIYLFVFQFALQELFSVIKYWDEFYALLAVFYWGMKHRNGLFHIKKDSENTFIYILIILLVGFISNFIWRYQELKYVLYDAFINIKFWLAIYTTQQMFRTFDLIKYKARIAKHVKVIVYALFGLLIINKIYPVFPYVLQNRLGGRSEQLFFGHATGLASVSFFLLLLICLFDIRSFLSIAMSVGLVFSAMRYKTIASAAVFVLFYICIVILKKKMNWKYAFFFVPILLAIGWEQIVGYFFSPQSMDMARGALLYTSTNIAMDYFPIGTGFATFGSFYSGVQYSPVYINYGISHIFGMTNDNYTFIADTFWPMIIGQFGVIGVVSFLLALLSLFKKIQALYKVDRNIYLAAISVLLYLLISSSGESAFVNPLACSMSVIIGCAFNMCKNIRVRE